MAIKLAYQQDSSSIFSDGGAFSNPLCFTFNGIDGGEKIAELLVLNDDSSAVSDIGIALQGTLGSDIDSVKFKLIGESAAEWETSLSGITISGNNNQRIDMKIKMGDPPISVKSIKDLKVRISY